jgi:CBS domain containing-hemolysin-like protein
VLEHGPPIGLLAFRSVAAVPRDEWNARRVRDAMIPRDAVPLLDEDDPAIDALAELSASDVNRGLVVDDDHLAGFLSITDLARALEVGRPSPPVPATNADRRSPPIRSSDPFQRQAGRYAAT